MLPAFYLSSTLVDLLFSVIIIVIKQNKKKGLVSSVDTRHNLPGRNLHLSVYMYSHG